MKTRTMAAMIVLMTMRTQAGEKNLKDEQTVNVCIEAGRTVEAPLAQAIAGKMFAEIGVQIKWRTKRECAKSKDALIHILLLTGAPLNHYPNALAFANPFEGRHITVFADRIHNPADPPRVVTCKLAHVLVHEITHILQGTDGHAASGIMKAKWNQDDFNHMAWKPLSFNPLDIELIKLGIKTWRLRATGMAAVLTKSESGKTQSSVPGLP
jgi:hypothetical protein